MDAKTATVSDVDDFIPLSRLGLESFSKSRNLATCKLSKNMDTITNQTDQGMSCWYDYAIWANLIVIIHKQLQENKIPLKISIIKAL